MIPLNYHHLYYFYVIAQEGSMAKACEKLLLAQPTLSAQLKELERSLGRRLFDRVNQRLSLTEDGRLVLGYAKSLFGIGGELLDALRDRPAKNRLALQVGAPTGSPRAWTRGLVDFIWRKDPDAFLAVREGAMDFLMEELRQHRLDAVLSDAAVATQAQEEFSNLLVGRVPVRLAAAPSLARRLKPLPRALDGAPFIWPAASPTLYQELQNAFAAWKVKPRGVAEVADVDLARQIVAAGRGVSAFNALTLEESGLAVLRTPGLALFEPIYLITRRRQWPNPLADHLVKNFRLKTAENRLGLKP